MANVVNDDNYRRCPAGDRPMKTSRCRRQGRRCLARTSLSAETPKPTQTILDDSNINYSVQYQSMLPCVLFLNLLYERHSLNAIYYF